MSQGTSLREALEESEKQLAAEKRLLRDKDAQLAGLEKNIEEQRAAGSGRSVEDLRTQLARQQEEHREELAKQSASMLEESHKELAIMEAEQDAASTRLLQCQSELVQQELSRAAEATDLKALAASISQAERAGVCEKSVRSAQEHLATLRKREEEARESHLERLREAAVAEVALQTEEADYAERELHKLREQLGPIRVEHTEAADALREARRLLHSEENCARAESSTLGEGSHLEQQLAEAHVERARSEQRYADLEKHLRAQMHDLQGEICSRTQELYQRNILLQRRDQELLEVSRQLADLQGLFSEINSQLQTECTRIEKMQEAVAHFSRQNKDLEMLQGMLEDSHRMLAQVRGAVERERAERIKAADLLEHEQQRTQLLLDVLKHFKEKLGGLTPQMLLGHLGRLDQPLAVPG